MFHGGDLCFMFVSCYNEHPLLNYGLWFRPGRHVRRVRERSSGARRSRSRRSDFDRAGCVLFVGRFASTSQASFSPFRTVDLDGLFPSFSYPTTRNHSLPCVLVSFAFIEIVYVYRLSLNAFLRDINEKNIKWKRGKGRETERKKERERKKRKNIVIWIIMDPSTKMILRRIIIDLICLLIGKWINVFHAFI